MIAHSVVDIFCGVGGLTHGFVKENFNVVAGLDIDETCQYAYEYNNRAAFLCQRIEDIDPKDISDLYPENHIKILIGCAPCQPFSKYKTKGGSKDDKWKLVDAFANLIVKVQPDVVSMENVPQLLKFNKSSVYNSFVECLKANGYYVKHYVVYCPNYGIPQKRTRLVVFASKFREVSLIEPTHTEEHYRTVGDVLSEIPVIEAGMTHKDDPLHKSVRLSELNRKRIKQSLPGGSWMDWDEELRTACHTRSSGTTYKSVYGRMSWDKPSPTLTTECYAYGSGRFGHPQQDRALSLREAALLQTFPPDYKFAKPESPLYFNTVGRHIGNAVPVDLGRVIAKSIAQHLEEHNGGDQRAVQDVYQYERSQSFGDRSLQ